MSEAPGPRTMRYRGNHTGKFDEKTGAGLVGKVIGPDLNGRYYAVDLAEYDEETDKTTAYLIQLIPPQAAFDRAIDQGVPR